MGQMTPPHSPDSRYLVFIAPRGCRIFSRQFREFRGGGADAIRREYHEIGAGF